MQLTESGDFLLHNEGKRPLYVSSNVVLPRASLKLQHNQILEVSSYTNDVIFVIACDQVLKHVILMV